MPSKIMTWSIFVLAVLSCLRVCAAAVCFMQYSQCNWVTAHGRMMLPKASSERLAQYACSTDFLWLFQATQVLTQQLRELVTVLKVHPQTHRNSITFNGCAIVDLADTDDSPATAQVQALLQPALHVKIKLPIQPTAAPILIGARDRTLGCPHIAPFSGHSRTSKEHSKGNRARIYCSNFIGITSAAAMHLLRLHLCDVADQDSMEDSKQADRSELLSAMQIIQPAVSKPDSYRDHEASDRPQPIHHGHDVV